MPTYISPLSQVDPQARLGENVWIGPFCLIGPDVCLGDDCRLDSHVTIVGHTTIGSGNRFWPNSVIGAEPQDKSYEDTITRTLIGEDNQFREGVTVNRGAAKEDGCTRIGNRNLLMANSHVAHNCHVFNDVILVNGVLLGGHVHLHDRAIISGNSVVHHFSTVGTLAFVSGGCRVPHDIPPFMLSAGSDNPEIKTINVIGMRRAGISNSAIGLVKQAYRYLYREHRPLDETRELLAQEVGDAWPIELATLLSFLEKTRAGKLGRAREAVRKSDSPGDTSESAAA